ncbi:hypothetical protein FLP41_09760 [Paracoccus marcusii]|uniref:hypothetical protein n=1 Tax=Paracoccus marcusii TaxID=59779 RepID=UPI002ED2950C|nr:hypothetical protein FLP41_09760 [Paracoccus marcusii]
MLGLRDIIDRPSVMRQQWLRQRNFEALQDHYDDIWVYGDPAFFPRPTNTGWARTVRPRDLYRLSEPAGAPVARCAGADPLQVTGGDARPFVLCQVGGGRDGVALCTAFAAAPMPAGHQGILITGTQMPPEARARVAALAQGRTDLTVVDFVAEPVGLARARRRLWRCAATTPPAR